MNKKMPMGSLSPKGIFNFHRHRLKYSHIKSYLYDEKRRR